MIIYKTYTSYGIQYSVISKEKIFIKHNERIRLEKYLNTSKWNHTELIERTIIHYRSKYKINCYIFIVLYYFFKPLTKIIK